MSDESSPGYEAYKCWLSFQFSDVSAHEMWDALEPSGRRMWESVAAAAKVSAPPPESVDVYLRRASFVADGNGGTEVNLTVFLPNVHRHSKPGAPKRLMDILDGASGHYLRLSSVAVEEAASEFQRLQPDGTVRQLEEGEGTW